MNRKQTGMRLASGKTAIAISLGFFIVATILTGIIAGLYPLLNDDIVFADVFGCAKHTICPGTEIDVFGNIQSHHMLVNGRFGDMFSTFFSLIPSSLYALIYAIGYAGLILMMAKTAGISFRKNPWRFAWLNIFTLVCFPWIDFLYIRALFLNYYPAAILALAAICYFISEKKAPWLKSIAMIIVGLFAGCWHEEVPLILFPSAILYCCITRKITRNQVLIAIGMAVGVAFLMTCPEFFNRTKSIPVITDNRRLVAIAFGALNLTLSGAALLLYHLRGDKSRQRAATVWALALPVIPSCLVMMNSTMSTRICFFSIVFSITALLYASRGAVLRRKMRILLKSLCVIAMILLTAQLALTILQTAKVRKSTDEIIRLAAENSEKPIYYDLDEINISPLPTFYKSFGKRFITDTYSRSNIARYTKRNYWNDILHPALADFDITRADTIDKTKGYYQYKGCIVITAQADADHYLAGSVKLTYADGSTSFHKFNGIYFEDSTGRKFNYLYCISPRLPRETQITGLELLNYEALSRTVE